MLQAAAAGKFPNISVSDIQATATLMNLYTVPNFTQFNLGLDAAVNEGDASLFSYAEFGPLLSPQLLATITHICPDQRKSEMAEFISDAMYSNSHLHNRH